VASEHVLDIPVRRHVLTSERAFQAGRRLVRLIAGHA
jgi:hypothetical protein